MSIFVGSSHERCWLFTPTELAACRQLANTRAAVAAHSATANHDSASRQSDRIYTTPKSEFEPQFKIEEIKHSAILEDEELLLRHFCRQIELSISPQESAAANGTKQHWWRVFASAIVFLRRFFLNNSMATHDPRIIMLGCILVASKVEDIYERKVSMNELKRLHGKCPEDAILRAELSVLQALNFQTRVFLPHNVCQVLGSDIKRKHSSKGAAIRNIGTESSPAEAAAVVVAAAAAAAVIEPAVLDCWFSAAEQLISALLITNASLLCSPVEIAFAALYLTEAGAHAADTVEVKKDVINITLKSESDRPASSVFLTYFSSQFGQAQYSACMLKVPLILDLLEGGQNCREGAEVPRVRAAMATLKARAHWHVHGGGGGGGGGGEEVPPTGVIFAEASGTNLKHEMSATINVLASVTATAKGKKGGADHARKRIKVEGAEA